jgi:hypothetical protein
MGDGCASDRAFIHAADHDLHAEGSGLSDHSTGGGDSAAFGQFDINAMKMAPAGFDVFFPDAGFISNERERRLVEKDLHTCPVVFGQRLFDKLYA